jgi:purine-binding chemotaxis protein CheW
LAEDGSSEKFSERQLVVFKIGTEEFGVDINEVREIIKMEDITKIPNTEEYIVESLI